MILRGAILCQNHKGGTDAVDNLQPMHKKCNNDIKENLLYVADYYYDIKSDISETCLSVRGRCVKRRKKNTIDIFVDTGCVLI